MKILTLLTIALSANFAFAQIKNENEIYERALEQRYGNEISGYNDEIRRLDAKIADLRAYQRTLPADRASVHKNLSAQILYLQTQKQHAEEGKRRLHADTVHHLRTNPAAYNEAYREAAAENNPSRSDLKGIQKMELRRSEFTSREIREINENPNNRDFIAHRRDGSFTKFTLDSNDKKRLVHAFADKSFYSEINNRNTSLEEAYQKMKVMSFGEKFPTYEQFRHDVGQLNNLSRQLDNASDVSEVKKILNDFERINKPYTLTLENFMKLEAKGYSIGKWYGEMKSVPGGWRRDDGYFLKNPQGDQVLFTNSGELEGMIKKGSRLPRGNVKVALAAFLSAAALSAQAESFELGNEYDSEAETEQTPINFNDRSWAQEAPARGVR
nr:hypothetical protein HAGR004_40100 [Bdellovibrio sp. HAGR004]